MAYADWDFYPMSETSQEKLTEYWNSLLKHADFLEPEEFKFFLHCTKLSTKEKIVKSGTVRGGLTDLPRRAPLACHSELRGVWLAPATKELPTRSPYGTHRLVFKARDILSYLWRQEKEQKNEEDVWDAEINETKSKNKKGKHKNNKKSKHAQKDCYKTKDKSHEKNSGPKPLLFFEHAHYYGNTQYVRLILMRGDSEHAAWCHDNLLNLNIHDNPFFKLQWGRVYSYTIGETGKREVMVEILLLDDIRFSELNDMPTWDEVSKTERAGFDPRVGVLD